VAGLLRSLDRELRNFERKHLSGLEDKAADRE